MQSLGTMLDEDLISLSDSWQRAAQATDFLATQNSFLMLRHFHKYLMCVRYTLIATDGCLDQMLFIISGSLPCHLFCLLLMCSSLAAGEYSTQARKLWAYAQLQGDCDQLA